MRTEKKKPDPLLRKLLTRLDELRPRRGGTPRPGRSAGPSQGRASATLPLAPCVTPPAARAVPCSRRDSPGAEVGARAWFNTRRSRAAGTSLRPTSLLYGPPNTGDQLRSYEVDPASSSASSLCSGARSSSSPSFFGRNSRPSARASVRARSSTAGSAYHDGRPMTSSMKCSGTAGANPLRGPAGVNNLN